MEGRPCRNYDYRNIIIPCYQRSNFIDKILRCYEEHRNNEDSKRLSEIQLREIEGENKKEFLGFTRKREQIRIEPEKLKRGKQSLVRERFELKKAEFHKRSDS